mgnify:CR=1 FL=1
MSFRSRLRTWCAGFVVACAAGVALPALAQQSTLDQFLSGEGAFLEEVQQQRALESQILQAAVEQQLRETNNQDSGSLERSIEALKHSLQTVEAAGDLPASVRAQLRDRIVNAIRQSQRRLADRQQRDQLAAARRAEGLQQQCILAESSRREEKLTQINERYVSLLDERRWREAESVAVQGRDLAPANAVMRSAVLNARTAGYVGEMNALRETRQRAVVDALARVEAANVPFAGEPPIVYPDAQVWEELTRRREKYAAMSLDKTGSAEQRIFQALGDTTTMEFIEMPLRDVMDYVEDLHGIEVDINYRALEEVGIGADTPITRNLKGISLRSALKLMLRELDLTYTVRDEVLQITTPEEVAEDLTTKVYPVEDLVVPIPSGGGSNPFQMGGGLGGPGGFGQGNGRGNNNQMPGGNFPNLFGGDNNFNAIGPAF